jgi:hypothetical protein
MLRNTRQTLCAGAMLAAATIAPNAALAFGLLPLHPLGLGGLHLGLAGPHALPHFGGIAPHAGLAGPPRLGPSGSARVGRGGFGGVARSGVPSGVRSSARYGRNGYAHGGSRHRDWGRYAGYGSGYGSGSAGSDGDDGCYYTHTSGGRRVSVCSDN